MTLDLCLIRYFIATLPYKFRSLDENLYSIPPKEKKLRSSQNRIAKNKVKNKK